MPDRRTEYYHEESLSELTPLISGRLVARRFSTGLTSLFPHLGAERMNPDDRAWLLFFPIWSGSDNPMNYTLEDATISHT